MGGLRWEPWVAGGARGRKSEQRLRFWARGCQDGLVTHWSGADLEKVKSLAGTCCLRCQDGQEEVLPG